jgi:hypothetical protein
MDKSELLKKALNKEGVSDLNLNSAINTTILNTSSSIETNKFDSKSSFLNKGHSVTKNTFIDEKGKNKQVLKNLKNSKKY